MSQTCNTYVTIFAGILVHEIVRKLALQKIFMDTYMYIAGLILRPITDKNFTVFVCFLRLRTNLQKIQKLIHHEDFNEYGIIYLWQLCTKSVTRVPPLCPRAT